MLSWGVDAFCKSFLELAKLEVDDIGHDVTKEGVQELSHVTNDTPAASEQVSPCFEIFDCATFP